MGLTNKQVTGSILYTLLNKVAEPVKLIRDLSVLYVRTLTYKRFRVI